MSLLGCAAKFEALELLHKAFAWISISSALTLSFCPQEAVDDEQSEDLGAVGGGTSAFGWQEWLTMLQAKAGADLRDAFSLKACTTKACESYI